MLDNTIEARGAIVQKLTFPFLPSFLLSRAGELNSDELERIVTIMQNPAQFKIPAWFVPPTHLFLSFPPSIRND